MTAWTPDPDAWRDWFPAQTCPGCDQEHPGQPCPEQEPLPIDPTEPNN